MNTREFGLLRSEIGNEGWGTVMGAGTFDLGLRSDVDIGSGTFCEFERPRSGERSRRSGERRRCGGRSRRLSCKCDSGSCGSFERNIPANIPFLFVSDETDTGIDARETVGCKGGRTEWASEDGVMRIDSSDDTLRIECRLAEEPAGRLPDWTRGPERASAMGVGPEAGAGLLLDTGNGGLLGKETEVEGAGRARSVEDVARSRLEDCLVVGGR